MPKFSKPVVVRPESPKLRVDSSPGSPAVSDELKKLRLAVNLLAEHLESKFAAGIFTPEERELMGLPVRE